ncbi:MAG TPA: hypothetical protein VHH36_00075 [Candidatus Thermoplasmatota archaeon]|nr:hypothetical protein [Candidatus Thermoplasmatota archaeon]
MRAYPWTDGHFPTRETSIHSSGTPGARHRITNVAWLGSWASVERDAAGGYDQDGVNNYLDDQPDHDRHDDGLLPLTMRPGSTANLQFVVTSHAGVDGWYVNVLVDWNQDGWWYQPAGGAAEWVAVNVPIDVEPMTSRLFSVPVTAGSKVGAPWVRVTLSDVPLVNDPSDFAFSGGDWSGAMPAGIRDATGASAFECGETEDSVGILRVAKPTKWWWGDDVTDGFVRHELVFAKGPDP